MTSEVDRPLTAEEQEMLHEIEHHERIVAFHNAIMSGTHPTIKPSPDLMETWRKPPINYPPSPPSVQSASTPPNPPPKQVPSQPRGPIFAPPRQPRAFLDKHSVEIDFLHDYYKDLGVDSHVGVDSINRGFKSKAQLYSPNTTAGKSRWTAREQATREKAQQDWNRVKKAHDILSSKKLRGMYDAGRPATAPKKAASGGKVERKSRKGRR